MSDVMIEVIERETTLGQELAPSTIIVSSFSKRASEIASSLSEVAGKLRSGLDSNLDEPESKWAVDTVKVKFSLDLEAEAGVIITRAKTSAAFEASITWKKT